MTTSKADQEPVTIRRAEPDDYTDVYNIFSCPGVVAGTLQIPYPSLEQWRKKFTDPESGIHSLVAVVGGRVIGLIGIHTFPDRPRRSHAAMIGMCVHDDFAGRGVGKKLMRAALDMADNWLNLKRLELEVYVDNEAAIHLYEQFGFEREGTLKQMAFRNGSYVDSYAMARLR